LDDRDEFLVDQYEHNTLVVLCIAHFAAYFSQLGDMPIRFTLATDKGFVQHYIATINR